MLIYLVHTIAKYHCMFHYYLSLTFHHYFHQNTLIHNYHLLHLNHNHSIFHTQTVHRIHNLQVLHHPYPTLHYFQFLLCYTNCFLHHTAHYLIHFDQGISLSHNHQTVRVFHYHLQYHFLENHLSQFYHNHHLNHNPENPTVHYLLLFLLYPRLYYLDYCLHQ